VEKRYVGVDLHRNQFTVCVRLENGRTYLREWRLAGLPQFVKKLRGSDEVAVEATGNTRMFYDAVRPRIPKPELQERHCPGIPKNPKSTELPSPIAYRESRFLQLGEQTAKVINCLSGRRQETRFADRRQHPCGTEARSIRQRSAGARDHSCHRRCSSLG
jgi:hypothetical protein